MDLSECLYEIVQVQALVRGMIERRKYKLIVSTQSVSPYFSKVESLETCTGLYAANATLAYRVHQYECSGAVYSGQWLGGLRHGRGHITWKDQTRYEGDWQYN